MVGEAAISVVLSAGCLAQGQRRSNRTAIKAVMGPLGDADGERLSRGSLPSQGRGGTLNDGDFVPRYGAQRQRAVRAEEQRFERFVPVARNLDPPLDSTVHDGVVAMGVDVVDARLRDRSNELIRSVMDDGLAANRVLKVPVGVWVEKQSAQLVLMGPEDNSGIVGQRTHAGTKKHAQVEQLDGGIVDRQMARAVPDPWIGERRRCPLCEKGLLEVLVEVLLARFAE